MPIIIVIIIKATTTKIKGGSEFVWLGFDFNFTGTSEFIEN